MESHRSSKRRIAERGGTSRTDAVETTAGTDLGTGIGAVETTAGTDLGTGIGANTENRMRIDKGLGAGRMT